MKPTEHLTITERPGTYITVMSDSSGPIIVVSDGPGARASRYTPEEAAKLGLAILEAAGVTETDSPYMQEAADNLRAYILLEEKVTAEARELAELEAEALELVNAHRKACGSPTATTWDDLTLGAKENWLAVARRAREMRTEK